MGLLCASDGESEIRDEGRVQCPRRVDRCSRQNSVRRGVYGESDGELIRSLFAGASCRDCRSEENFDEFTLSETTTNAIEPPTKFAYPPLPWIGARFKFEVREKDGNNCLVKTIDNPFFQRAMVFMGLPELHNYTIEADVMSEGNKRKMSDVGLINQRYLIMLKGNEKKLEITSNQELLNQASARCGNALSPGSQTP